jgi:hypothetical protein
MASYMYRSFLATGRKSFDFLRRNVLRYPFSYFLAAKAKEPSMPRSVRNALWENEGVLALDGLSIVASVVPGGKAW